MGKSALDAKRRDSFLLEPERLTLIYDKPTRFMTLAWKKNRARV